MQSVERANEVVAAEAARLRNDMVICRQCRTPFNRRDAFGRRNCRVHPSIDACTTDAFLHASNNERVGYHRCCGRRMHNAPNVGHQCTPYWDPHWQSARDGQAMKRPPGCKDGCHTAEHHTMRAIHYQNHGERYIAYDDTEPGGMVRAVPGDLLRRLYNAEELDTRLLSNPDVSYFHLDRAELVTLDSPQRYAMLRAGGSTVRCDLRATYFDLAARYGYSAKSARVTSNAYNDSPSADPTHQADPGISGIMSALLGERQAQQQPSGRATDEDPDSDDDDDNTNKTQSITAYVASMLDRTSGRQSASTASTYDDDFFDIYIYAWVSPDNMTTT